MSSGKSHDDEVEIDGVRYSYRCDICWQELDETDIQFKPCHRCHLQVCLFCFNKHTNQKTLSSKTCPKCREPIDVDAIMKQTARSDKNAVAKKLLSNKRKKRKKGKETVPHGHSHNHNAGHSHMASGGGGGRDHHHAMDIDEEVPKSDWKQYLKGRFISRDSIIVGPVIAKFNNEEAINDNFKAYGHITRINMWDDESAHIMYDKQYFADALVEKIQDVAVRYQGQFGLMNAKYHFRRPCEEFMDPDRRCPMQCRKFHGPYYKIDFIPLDCYLDEEQREEWIEQRRKRVAGIVKTRYKKFRKKFMDGTPLPITGDKLPGVHEYRVERDCDGNYKYTMATPRDTRMERDDANAHHQTNSNEYTEKGVVGNGRKEGQRSTTTEYQSGSPRHSDHSYVDGNKRSASKEETLRQHMQTRPNQPMPPIRPPPDPPLVIEATIHQQCAHGMTNGMRYRVKDEMIGAYSQNGNGNGNGNGNRTRPPMHTTSGQMRPFMQRPRDTNERIQRTRSDETSKMSKKLSMRSTHSETEVLSTNSNSKRNGMRSAVSTHDRNDHGSVRSIYSNGGHSPPYCAVAKQIPRGQLQHDQQRESKNSYAELVRIQTEKHSPQKTHHGALPTNNALKAPMMANESKPTIIGHPPPPDPKRQKAMREAFARHGLNAMHPLANHEIHGFHRGQHVVHHHTYHHQWDLGNLGHYPMAMGMHHNASSAVFNRNNIAPNQLRSVHPLKFGSSGSAPGGSTNTRTSRRVGSSSTKSTLNASAPAYVPPSTSTSTSQQFEAAPVHSHDESTGAGVTMPKVSRFKMPKIGSNSNRNLRDFDIRNLGPLIADSDILDRDVHRDYVYDFGAALNESHLDLNGGARSDDSMTKTMAMDVGAEKVEKGEVKEVVIGDGGDGHGVHCGLKEFEHSLKSELQSLEIAENNEQISDDREDGCYTASSEEWSGDDDEYPNLNGLNSAKWTQEMLWSEVCHIAAASESTAMRRDDDRWQSVRGILKSKLSLTDCNWVDLRDSSLMKKIEARFRSEYKVEFGDNAVGRAPGGDDDDGQSIKRMLDRLSLRTTAAKEFANLEYGGYSVVDVEVLIGDVRNEITNLLTKSTSTASPESSNVEIAELGQILSVYQWWIDGKGAMRTPKMAHSHLIDSNHDYDQEIDEEEGIKQLFGVRVTVKEDEDDEVLIDGGDAIHCLNGHDLDHDHGMEREDDVLSDHDRMMDSNGGKAVDFYSRLLEEAQQNAMEEDGDIDAPHRRDHFDFRRRPTNLVMDYIGCCHDEFGTVPLSPNHELCKNEVKMEDGTGCKVGFGQNQNGNLNENGIGIGNEEDDEEALYDYEYSDESEVRSFEKHDDDTDSDQGHDDDERADVKASEPNDVFDLIANSIALVQCTELKEEEEADHRERDDDQSANDEFKNGTNTMNTSRPSPPMHPPPADGATVFGCDGGSKNGNGTAVLAQNGMDPTESAFFSRVHSPPPRHRGIHDEAVLPPVHVVSGTASIDGIQLFANHERISNDENTNENHHYYNARYPPRRGRYSRSVESGKGAYYRPKNQYHRNSQTATKMEWKRKEKKIEHKIKVGM